MNSAETLPQCRSRWAENILGRRTFCWRQKPVRTDHGVEHQKTRFGGLFNSRAEPLRFAFREGCEAPGAVVLVPNRPRAS
jgi:hypothetical protein